MPMSTHIHAAKMHVTSGGVHLESEILCAKATHRVIKELDDAKMHVTRHGFHLANDVLHTKVSDLVDKIIVAKMHATSQPRLSLRE